MSRLNWVLLSLAFPSTWTTSHEAAAQEETLTRGELQAMLRERDAIIIDLQHTVNELVARLTDIEEQLRPDSALELPESAGNDNGAALSADADPNGSRDNTPRLVVDEAAAERALERTLVQSGALLLPRGAMEFAPTLSYSFNESSFPVAAVVGADPELGSNSLESNVTSFDLTTRFGLPFDSQLEIGIPYRSVELTTKLKVAGQPLTASDQSGNGTGDARIGFAKTLLRENGGRPDIVGRITWGSGSGDRVNNGVLLGGGFESVGASLSFVKRRDPLALFFTLDYQDIHEDDDIDPGDRYSVSFGTALAVSPDSSLSAAVAHQFVSETKIGADEIEGSDFTATSLSLGLGTILRRGALLNVHAQVGVSEYAPDYSVGFSIPFQWRPRR